MIPAVGGPGIVKNGFYIQRDIDIFVFFLVNPGYSFGCYINIVQGKGLVCICNFFTVR